MTQSESLGTLGLSANVLVAFGNPKQDAMAIREYLEGFIPDFTSQPRLHALYYDVYGLLTAIGEGIVHTSQPRIADRLIEISSGISDKDVVCELGVVISACAERGLSAENVDFHRHTSRRIGNSKS